MTNEEVIRTLTRLKNQINFEWTDAQKKMDALNVAIEALQGQQWIPCSKRLPIIDNNIAARVLITTSWGSVREAYYCVDHWEINGMSYKLSAATAWMPLPDPWKGGE